MILNKKIAESLVNKGKLIKDRIKQSYNICIYKQFCSLIQKVGVKTLLLLGWRYVLTKFE